MAGEKTIRVGGKHAADSILTSLELNHLDKETLIDLLFIKQKEGKEDRGATFFSHFNKESTEAAISNERFLEIYKKFSLARKQGNEELMEEAILEYKGLATSVNSDSLDPAQRNP